LSRGQLQQATLHLAILRYADIRDADLSDAPMHGTDFRWASLGGADLRRAQPDQDTNFASATYDDWTRWPDEPGVPIGAAWWPADRDYTVTGLEDG